MLATDGIRSAVSSLSNASAFLESDVLAFGRIEHLLDCRTIPLPVGAQISLEVLNRVAFGIRHKHMVCDGGGVHQSKVEYGGEM